jgi:glutamate carboxypeptidase
MKNGANATSGHMTDTIDEMSSAQERSDLYQAMKMDDAGMGEDEAAALLRHFEARLPQMIDTVDMLVNMESPSNDVDALNRVAKVLATYIAEACGPCEIEWHHLGEEQRPHLVVRLGERTDVLLIGHFDTVHPVGTLEQNPFRITGDRLYGPGSLDMKSGVVLMVEVARYIVQHNRRPNLTLFINSDEELGSTTSVPLVRKLAEGGKIALAFESTLHEGLLKIGARGVRRFKVTATGKGGHAAYAEHNVNPVDAIADIIVDARRLCNPANGIVVTPTVITASDAPNVVPNTASVILECRGDSERKLDEVERSILRMKPTDDRVTVLSELVVQVETFEMRSDNAAFAFARQGAELLGMPEPKGVEARGAGDVNAIASIIPDAMEGLGGWGDGLHDPEREHVMVSSLVPSVALSAMITQLCLNEHR